MAAPKYKGHKHASSTRVSPNEAQGVAGVPQAGSSQVGNGFSWAIDQMSCNSRDPWGIKGTSGEKIQRKAGLWGDGFQRP